MELFDLNMYNGPNSAGIRFTLYFNVMRASIGSLYGDTLWLEHVWIGKKDEFQIPRPYFDEGCWHLLTMTLSNEIKYADLAQIMWRHWNNIIIFIFFQFLSKWINFIHLKKVSILWYLI